MAAPPIIIEAHRVSKLYGSTYALREASFSLAKGFTLLLGPNGSGKSTLLSMVYGFVRPSTGSLRVFGLDPSRHGGAVRKRSVFSTDPPSLPLLDTVHDVLEALLDTGALDPRRVEEALHLFGLGEHLGKRVRSLSAGYRKKLSLLLAYARKGAELVLLDEPFANLDAESVSKTARLVEKMLGAGASLLLATHILPPSLPRPDNVLVLVDGRLVEHGAVLDVASKHRALAVRIEEARPGLVEEIGRLHPHLELRGSTLVVRGLDRGLAERIAGEYNGVVDVDMEALSRLWLESG